jgi:hypothetical protein
MSSSSSEILPVYPSLVLAHQAPYLWDAILSVTSIGGPYVRFTYDIRAKCKWDKVVDYSDISSVQAALDEVLFLIQKSLRPRVPARVYKQHVIDVREYFFDLAPISSSGEEMTSSEEEVYSSTQEEIVSSGEEAVSSGEEAVSSGEEAVSSEQEFVSSGEESS